LQLPSILQHVAQHYNDDMLAIVLFMICSRFHHRPRTGSTPPWRCLSDLQGHPWVSCSAACSFDFRNWRNMDCSSELPSLALHERKTRPLHPGLPPICGRWGGTICLPPAGSKRGEAKWRDFPQIFDKTSQIPNIYT
jgi:hypothetical protein